MERFVGIGRGIFYHHEGSILCGLLHAEMLVSIDSFDEAVQTASEIAEEGDIVLLSPACAAFDRFKNFAERGRHFKQLVEEMQE